MAWVTYKGISHYVCNMSDLEALIEKSPGEPGEIYNLYLDITKAAREEPSVSYFYHLHSLLKNIDGIQKFMRRFADLERRYQQLVTYIFRPEVLGKFLTESSEIEIFVKLFPEQKGKLAEFIFKLENLQRLQKSSDIEVILKTFPEKEGELAEFIFKLENLERLLKSSSNIEIFVKLFPQQKGKLAEFLFKPENLQRLLKRSWDIQFFWDIQFVGEGGRKLTKQNFTNFYRYLKDNISILLKGSIDIENFAKVYRKEGLINFIFREENADRLLKNYSDILIFLRTFPQEKEKLAVFIFKPENLQRVLQKSSDIKPFMQLFSNKKNEMAEFIFKHENFNGLLKESSDVKFFRELFLDNEKEFDTFEKEFNVFIFKPENLGKLLQKSSDIEVILKTFPQKKTELAKFIFKLENLGKLLQKFSDIEVTLKTFPEKKGELAGFIFHPRNASRLLKDSSDVKFFVKEFTKEIVLLMPLGLADPGYNDFIPLLEGIVEEAFCLNDIETCKALCCLPECQHIKYFNSAQRVAKSSSYTVLENIFSRLSLGQTIPDSDWGNAAIQKYFFDHYVHDGIKFDKYIAARLSISQMKMDVAKLSILKNDIVIHLIKEAIISIGDALELDQNYIEACRELYESAKELLPLLGGEHPVRLDELMPHKENAQLKFPSIQRLIIKGKATVNDVISLSNEDILTIAAREEDISCKISPEKGITLRNAIEMSLKDDICCTVDEGETVLMVGPATIVSHNLSNCVTAILIKGQANTGQDAHVFCHFGPGIGSIGKTKGDFTRVFSQMNSSTCKAILVSNKYPVWADAALNFLKHNLNINHIFHHCPNQNTPMRTYFDISYATSSGEILIESPKWAESVSFDRPQTQENSTALDVEYSSSGPFFPPANKKRRLDSSLVREPTNLHP